MYALVDGNSFYASCERVFRPDIRTSPIVVLSNNDGCVITRTAEAKALGIEMGEPYFKIRKLCEQHNVVVFSSNYELYGDISRRMMGSIATLVPRIEIYSIDECFADIAGLKNLTPLAHQIRDRVQKWVGIPTCVGVAPTKTIAKYCNHLAKQHKYFKGVVNWNDFSSDEKVRAFKSQPVGKIWGIGRRIGEKLSRMGVKTVHDFVTYDTQSLRKCFGVVIERTQRELQGISCLEFEDIQPTKQQIIRSRSFGQPVHNLDGLRSAIATHIGNAAHDLRAQKSVANVVGVLIRTNPFREDDPQYNAYLQSALPVGSCDTFKLNEAAQKLLSKAYKNGYSYKKCGVVLMGIEQNVQQLQTDWLNPGDTDERLSLMAAMDGLNKRFGKGTIRTGDQAICDRWSMRRDKLSPCYTTRLNEVLTVS